MGRALEAQQKRVQDLMERTTQLSSQAETSEPLVSRELYDSLRKVNQDDASAAKALRRDLMDSGRMTRALYDRLQAENGEEGTRMFDLSSELLKEGLVPQARDAERQARSSVDELRRGVERAAERVLGDDAEALRLAQSELQAITDQLDQEARQAQAAERPAPSSEGGGSPATSGQELAAGEPAPLSGPASGQTGPGNQPGDAPPQGRRGRPGQAEGDTAGRDSAPGPRGAGAERTAAAGQPGSGGVAGAPGLDLDSLLPPAERGQTGARTGRGGVGGYGGSLTGDDFADWTERLRDVEEVLDQPELRNAVAGARERARLFRQEYRRNLKKPDWAVVKADILRPLVEVKAKIGTELSRRQANDPLAPVDRDPVPARFAEPVRRYYEDLGKDK